MKQDIACLLKFWHRESKLKLAEVMEFTTAQATESAGHRDQFVYASVLTKMEEPCSHSAYNLAKLQISQLAQSSCLLRLLKSLDYPTQTPKDNKRQREPILKTTSKSNQNPSETPLSLLNHPPTLREACRNIESTEPSETCLNSFETYPKPPYANLDHAPN